MRILNPEKIRTSATGNRHFPGHIREYFLEAVQAFAEWSDGAPEPTVTIQVNYQDQQITISKVCGLVWTCTDILPGECVSQLSDVGVEPKSRTYAAAAHSLLAAIKELSWLERFG
jgi:peptide methionine sulfoxide reductase MsrA